jgi:dienelactone hydrolase
LSTPRPVTSFVGDIPLQTYAPADRDAPSAAAVLLFHGLRVSASTHEREARAIAAAGLTAILPDAPHHGARRSTVLETMPDALTLEGHRVLLRILREGRDEIPRLVDHALSLGHRKVAIAGISMGAFLALAGATIEPRLAAIASVFGTPDWTPRDGVVPPDLADAVAESPHLRLETFPPRPLLLLNGGRDDNVRPAPARDFAARLRPLYAASGGGPLVHRELPDVDHFPSDAVWSDLWSTAVTFLRDALGRDPSS